MKTFKTTALAALLTLAVVIGFESDARAAEHQVLLKTKGENGERNVFEPALLRIEPGDTVTFVPGMKGHNVTTIKGMVPAGAKSFKGKISKEITVTFDVPGVYGLRCLPHYGLGMVGLVVVGDDRSNLKEVRAKQLKGKAKARFEELFAALESQ